MTATLFSRSAAVATPLECGRLSALMPRHGTLELRWYAPKGTDPRTPRDRDEVSRYCLRLRHFCPRGGEGGVRFGRRVAHEAHRFESFTPDFATWVIFYGPVGGEMP